MRWFVLDSETNILNRGDTAVGTQQGHPACPDNHIVSLGEQYRQGGELQYNELYDAQGVKEVPAFLQLALAGHDVLLVMHNAPFDLQYLFKEWAEQMEEALPHIYIWDTMQAEFLLEGGDVIMPSLDRCSEERELPLKDDKIKEYWRNGVDTAFIPKDELLEYMWQDVDNTRNIFLDQWNAISQSPKLLELMRIKMDDKLLTTFMQWYGMHFNLATAQELLAGVDKDITQVYNTIMEEASKHFAEDFKFNPASPDQVSVLVFGGDYKIERVVPVFYEDGSPVIFKSGKRKGEHKTRKETFVLHTKGLGLSSRNIPPAKGGYSTSDEHLSKLEHPLISLLLAYRGLLKDKSTYYEGYSALVWPDGCIRPEQQHETVVTGRMSCAKPNLANVSKGDE